MPFSMMRHPLRWLCALSALAVTLSAQDSVDQIIFPHELHVAEMEMECGDCHDSAAQSTALSHDLLPVQDDCLECHDGDTAPDDCATCHTRPEEPGTYGWLPTIGLQFPHQTHLQQNVPCEKCHPQQAEKMALAPRHMPTMSSCMQCHTTPLSDSGCLTCHATLQGKRPANHNPHWMKEHGQWAAAGSADCSMCHQQRDCEDCHARNQLEKKVHPPNFTLLHSGEFLSGATTCGSCHTMPEDCSTCHKSLVIMPLGHNSPLWATSSGSSFHGQEAIDRPEYCAVCHEPATDSSCLRCHIG